MIGLVWKIGKLRYIPKELVELIFRREKLHEIVVEQFGLGRVNFLARLGTKICEDGLDILALFKYGS